MTGLKTQNRRPAAGDPLNDLLDDTTMKNSGARARPRVSYAPARSSSSVWWIAIAASLVWTASVLAFSWARFSLPPDAGSVLDAASSRIGFSDWLMILAAIAGPVLLIWVIAWLVRRSMELRDESRKLAKAAILLADAAETAEKRAERLLPSPDGPNSEIITTGPGHLNREIERASHAMSALQTQMSSMEVALAKQAAAFDNAAEKTAARTRSLSAGTGLAGAAGVGLLGATTAAGASSSPSSPANQPAIESEAVVAVAGGSKDAPAAAVDLTLDAAEADKVADGDTGQLRTDLLAAGKSASWNKLAEEAPTLPEPQKPAQVSAAPKAVTAEDAAVDPFDDLGPSTPKAVAGAALGAGVAMGFGATRDEGHASGPSLGAPMTDEPAPAPLQTAKVEPVRTEPTVATTKPAAKGDDFEFMARALDWKKFVRAANFPENESDTATLDALYDVLTDPEAAALLQSSEDTLATLADLDLYMEDFVPEMSPVSGWRAHLEGKTGMIDPLDAPIEQSRINAKLGSDDSFRKLSERFVERYRVLLKRMFAEAADDRLALELADSRTGRAYILIAAALGKL